MSSKETMRYFLSLLRNIDKYLIIVTLIFGAISCLIIASITYDDGLVIGRKFMVQLIAYLLGYIGLFAMIFFDYDKFQKYEKHIYIASILFLLSVYTPLGHEEFGSRAWLDIGVTLIQPSELVKVSFVILMGIYFNKHRDNLYSLKGVAMALLYAAPLLLVVIKEDLGSGIIMAFVWIGMIFYSGIDGKLFTKLAAATIIALPIVYRFMASHQKDRIDAFLHPSNLNLRAAYQVWQSKIAIGSGGVFGKGLFNGTQKELDYVPVQDSDFIYSVIVEELGLIGGIALIGLFIFFFIRITKIALHAKDFYGSVIVIGFLSMFAFQTFENIAMTIGLMPVTGVTLPFISAGGTGIIANLIALGILINVGMRSKTINF